MHIGVGNGFIVAHVITDDKTHDGSIASQLIQKQARLIQSQVTKDMIKHRFNSQPMIIFEKVGRSTFILGKMRLYLNLKKLRSDNEINTLRRSMKMVCWLGEEHQATTVRAKLKTCSFDTKNYLVMHSMREMKTLVWLSLSSHAIF